MITSMCWSLLWVLQLTGLDATVPLPAWWQPWRPPAQLSSWATARVPRGGSVVRRLGRLHQAIVSPNGLGLRQGSGKSAEAEEVWRRRRADCVGFAYLYGGLARSLGIPTVFVVAEPGPAVPATQGLRLAEAHLAVGYRQGRRLWVIDFEGVRLDHRGEFEQIEDQAAAAILWSNRIARALLEDRCEDARRWTRGAGVLAATWQPLAGNRQVAARRCPAPE